MRQDPNQEPYRDPYAPNGQQRPGGRPFSPEERAAARAAYHARMARRAAEQDDQMPLVVRRERDGDPHARRSGRRMTRREAYEQGRRYEPAGQPPQNRQPNARRTSVGSAIFASILAILLFALSAGIVYTLLRYSILPLRYRLIVVGVMVLLNLIVFVLLRTGRRYRSARRSGIVVNVISLLIFAIVGYYLFRSVGFLNALFLKDQTHQVQVVVLKNSAYQSVSELDGQALAAPYNSDREVLDGFLKEINKGLQTGIRIDATNTYKDAADSLYQQTAEAMILNRSQFETIKEAYPNFDQETRVLTEQKIRIELEDLSKRVNTGKESFNMYISGIDTYGDIGSVSLSDVNIVMTVNPQTKKILLTNVPRDTYVELYGTNGGYDKLTHAGMFGIETSLRTLEQFLGTNLNYYTRVNFTSLIEIVDVLGGITVNNPVAFSTNDYTFEQGEIWLDGGRALAFSRERYNLPGGDFDRGMNQERVITGILNKVTQPEVLKQYGTLLSTFEKVAQTNMPTEDIMRLINVQIDQGGGWNVEMNAIAGVGAPGLPSYAMPGYELYMMQADADSVAATQEKIRAVLAER